jgi:hypothetical protein
MTPEDDGLVWAHAQIDIIAAEHNRKTRVKALTPQERYSLDEALLLVAKCKARAYDAAHQGARPSTSGWLLEQTALTAAVALLQANLIDVGSIPMMGNEASCSLLEDHA